MHLALDMVARILFAMVLRFDMQAVIEAAVSDRADGDVVIPEVVTLTMAPAEPLVVALRGKPQIAVPL